MAEDKIDSIIDRVEIDKEIAFLQGKVNEVVGFIKQAKGQNIDLNVNTKSIADYNAKIAALDKTMKQIDKSTNDAVKSSILLEKQRLAEAAAAEKIAKQQLAEIKLREANERAAKKEADAVAKANSAKNDLSSRPIESIPFEINTGDAGNTGPVIAQGEAFNALSHAEAEAAAEATALGQAQQYLNTGLEDTADATAEVTESLSEALTPLHQNIELRRRLQGSLDQLNAEQKEDLALMKAGTITKAEYNKRLTESQAKTAVYKQKISDLNRVIKEDIALEGKAGDAYKQLSAEYNRASLAAKNYQITLGKTHPTTIAAVADASRLSKQLKDVDDAVGQNGRNVGNYSNAITNATGKAFGVIRKLAYVLPGIGIAGIFSLIGEGIVAAVSSLNLFNSRLDDTARKRKILNDVQEQSAESIGKESASLMVLRATIESTEVPMATRLQAVKDLREQYPDYFKDLTNEQILTGNVGNAYNFAAAAIIRKAQAEVAAGEISKNEAKKLKLTREDLKDVEETNAKLAEKRGNSTVDEFGNLIDVTKQTNTLLRGAFKERQRIRIQELQDIKKDNAFLLKIAVDGAKETIKIDKLKTEKEKKGPKGRDLVEAERKAQFEILKANLELAKEFDLKRAEDQRKSFVERTTNIINYGADSQRLIEEQAKFELGAADLTAGERVKIENEKNNSLIRLATELNDKMQKLLSDQVKLFGSDTGELAAGVKGMTEGIAKQIAKIQADFAKLQADAIKKAADFKKALGDAYLSLATELEGLFFDIFQNSIERQKNAVQDQIDLLEKQKQKDIEVANSTITNAQQRADAIAVIEARAAAKREQLEAQQRKLDQRKAQFEKASAITGIIQSTALAIVKTLRDFPGPHGIALAAVIGAIGAAQLVRAIATPIPRYAEGTENHKGGPAIVGDGGKAEGVIMPDGSVYKTPSTDTLVNLPRGAKVYADYDKMLINSTMTKTPVFNLKTSDHTAQTVEKIGKDIVNAVKNIPQPILTSEGAWSRAMKTGSNFRQYLNKNI